MAELAGRSALVTGASRNIGRAIALALAEAGAAVAVNARTSRAEAESVAAAIAAKGGRAIVLLADVTDEAAVRGLVAAAAGQLGGLDILVNNAAVRHEVGIDDLDYAAWRQGLAAILDSAFLCSRAALPHLRASGAGTIVNLGGLSAHTGAARRAHVVAAKAGIVGLTRALAHELAADGITVNCVSPGLIDTPRGTASASGDPAHHARHATLSGRRGPPAEVAAMVRHLCGPAARFVTGQVIHVNGGAYLGG
ncbi:MAG: SDR family oxidoreductase [Alphaproteobacteria bacterium]|nr:SDR family oxidoreductase [Alphaproteobacteria bacterium]